MCDFGRIVPRLEREDAGEIAAWQLMEMGMARFPWQGEG
jgi:hypothetical protein